MITEEAACVPIDVSLENFNSLAVLPYGLTVTHIQSAMIDFVEFLGFMNSQLRTRDLFRLESMLMPANFSSIVGEFMTTTIPKYSPTIMKNRHHNGHPDLVPTGFFTNNAVQHSDQGIEVKASRYLSGWQGHNPEDIWLMVFVFDSNRPVDVTPKRFEFLKVVGAQLAKTDWAFSGRSEESRRTITASVTKSGYQKMMDNWIYKASHII